jgi:hypothetical protein
MNNAVTPKAVDLMPIQLGGARPREPTGRARMTIPRRHRAVVEDTFFSNPR